MVCDSAPFKLLVVPAIVGVSYPMPEFSGWKVRACQSFTFDGLGGVGDLDRSDVNHIHASAASGTLVGVLLRTAYFKKVVDGFDVPSVLKMRAGVRP